MTKVLLASDGSENAMEAARFLAGLAKRVPIHATVVTASYDAGHPRNSSTQPWYGEWTERETKRVSQEQAAIVAVLESVCEKVETVHRFGDPVPILLDETRQREPDLVVLGAKGHSTIHRLLLGSTSDTIATHVPCSVVVIRGVHPPEEDVSVKKLLIAYDGSDGSREAVAEQLGCHWDKATEVELVSVAAQAYAFFDDTYAAMAAAYEADEVERVRCDGERMCGQVAKQLPNTTLRVPRANHIGDAIVTAAESSGADLVVVGDAGHSLIGELFLGSTTKYVLRHAPCSVWISRHHRREDEPA